MISSSWIRSPITISALLVAAAHAGFAPAQAQAANANGAQITVLYDALLYDAFGEYTTMTKDWGFAAFIEYGGKPPKTMRFGTPWPQGNFTRITKTSEIAPGFHLIMLKSPWGVDLDVMEISLAIDTPDGIVLVVGCSHPAIEKIVAAAKKQINKPIHLVIGGTHLLAASNEDIRRVAVSLRDDWKVAWIAPVHCTGEPAFAILKEMFGARYLYSGLGTTLELGPAVKVVAEDEQLQTQAMDEADLHTYRALLQSSGDNPDNRLAHSGHESRTLLSSRVH